MVVIFTTPDKTVMMLEIENICSEPLNDNGYGIIRLNIRDNEYNIVKCEYEGYNTDDIMSSLRDKRIIDVDLVNWRIYKKFEAIVKFEDFKTLSEMVLLNNIVSQSKVSGEREGIVNTAKAWNELDILNKE